MTLASYKFISVHHDNSEHPVEYEGHSAGDAARRYSRTDHRCIRILDANPKSRNPRKLIWYRKGHEVDAVPETAIAVGMMQARMTTANMLLREFEKKGIHLTLEVVEDGDLVTKSIIASPRCSNADYKDIDENKESLIALLEELEAAKKIPPREPKPPVEKEEVIPAPNGSGNSHALQQVLKLLPPRHFQLYEIQQQLHKAQYHALADNESALLHLLADQVLTGNLELIKEGIYHLPGQHSLDIEAKAPRDIPSPQPASPPPSPPREPTPVSAPEASRTPGNPMEVIIGLVGALMTPPVDANMLEAALETCSTEMMESLEKLEKVFRPVIEQLRAQDNARRHLHQIGNPPPH